MLDGLRSSIALAQRTATKASETLTSTTRQIATGQRVSSVKDDGAAWTQAVALKADAVTSSTKARMVDGVISLNQAPLLTSAHATEAATRLREILMQAIDTVGASPEARAQLASTWTQEISGYGTAQKGANLLMKIEGVFWPTDEFDSLGTWFKPFNGIADMQDMRLRRAVFDFTSQYTGWSMDIQFGTVANLQARLVSLESQRRGYENAAFGAEAEEAQMERQRNRYDQSAEAYTIAADNLTSVDLEATSSQLRQAESRQQLALKTIKVAISAYGNYAGGLLGNVQRTQRALVG